MGSSVSILLIAFLSISRLVQAETVTFYAIKPTDPLQFTQGGEVTFSAIGVGSDGKTTYQQQYRYSQALHRFLRPTTTFLSTETFALRTLTGAVFRLNAYSTPDHHLGTIIMNDKGLSFTRAPTTASDAPIGEQFGFHQECEWNGQGGGKCEQDYYVYGDDRTATTTRTTTISGPTVPVYTLTVGSTGGNGNGSGNGGAGPVVPGMIAVGLGVILGFTNVMIA